MATEPTHKKELHAFADSASIADAGSIMQEIFQFPAHCVRANMQLMQQQLAAYSEFAQQCANCQKPEEFLEEYAHFGERMMADFSNYFLGIADVLGRAMRSGQIGSNVAASPLLFNELAKREISTVRLRLRSSR